MVEAPIWWISMEKDGFGKKIRHDTGIEIAKRFYENSKDFKVTWKLKEKINRKLHENRALALAIGYWLVNHDWIKVDQGYLYAVCGLGVSKKPFKVWYGEYWADECTLPDDYIIPDQVLQWMKEYQEQGK